ncbi:MAG: hypothetical protein WBG64_05655 [Thermoanaerobaculia bacterium]
MKNRNEDEVPADSTNCVVFTVVEDDHRVGPGLFFPTICTSEKALSFQHDDIGWRMRMKLLDLFSIRQGESQRSTLMIGVYGSTLPFPTDVQMLQEVK